MFVPPYFFIILLHQLLLSSAGDTPPISSLYSSVIDDNRYFDNNLPLHSLPKPRKWLLGFGAVNAIATLLTILLILLNILVYKLRELQESDSGERFDGLSLLPSEKICRRFSLGEILLATNNFDDSLVIGRGGFGKVYKGVIDNGDSIVAIKRLNCMSKQGAPEFQTELTMLSKFRHSNLVSLIGYCETYNEMILVYEYMVHGTIAEHLYDIGGNGGINVPLCWVQRLNICIGAARGLDYLHTGTGIKQRVIHRDIKSSNILLDENWAARISDFGLSKIGPANQSFTHVSTNVKGTFGYMDPEYFFTRKLTRKSDVYAFGVVLFEVLCGRPALDLRLDENQRGLAQWAQYCVKEGIIERIVDPNLEWEIFPDSLSAFVKIAEKCLRNSPKERPTMTEVVAELEFALTSQEKRRDSTTEEYSFNMGEAFSSQEIVDSPMKENVVSTVEGSVTKEVVTNVDNGDHQEKKVGKAFDVGRMKFTKKLRTFFPFTTRRISQTTPTDPVSARHTKVAPKNTVAGPNDREAVPNDKHTVRPVTIPSSQPLELRKIIEYLGEDRLISVGTCGRLYKVILKSGQYSCLKKLDPNKLSCSEFLEKVSIISSHKHENVVKLLGYCVDDGIRVLAYEYAPNGSLHDILHGRNDMIDAQPRPVLSWSQRVKIAVGAAKGIEYIHEKEDPFVVHCNIRSSNILLFEDDIAKIVDMHSSKPDPNTTARLCSTYSYWASGYRAPEIRPGRAVRDFGLPIGQFVHPLHAGWLHTRWSALTGKMGSETDVYSFGVVLLELLTGRKPFDCRLPLRQQHLVKWATPKLSPTEFEYCIDQRLGGNFPRGQARMMASIASRCLQDAPTDRPSMRVVVKELKMLNDRPSMRVVPERFTYEAILKSGQYSYLKKLDPNKLSHSEFLEKVSFISSHKHENVVKLLGYCVDDGIRVLAYEYAPNGSLHDILHGRNDMIDAQPRPVLSWSQRVKIAVGAAKGIEYFHEKEDPFGVHCNIRSSNILLFEDDIAKIVDMYSSKPDPNTTARLCSTYSYWASGYRAPEIRPGSAVRDFGLPVGQFVHPLYPGWLHGRWSALTGKMGSDTDVYSFGVVLLELLTGRKPFDYRLPHGQQHLVKWATPKLSPTEFEYCIDQRLGGNFPRGQARMMASIASRCLQDAPTDRPSMRVVVKELKMLNDLP